MPTFRCARFPRGTAHVSTSRGIVEFRDGLAEVDTDEIAEALRAVPDVFGISECFGEAEPVPGGQKPSRPVRSAGKEEWVAYAVATLSLTEEQARSMTKDRLIELAP